MVKVIFLYLSIAILHTSALAQDVEIKQKGKKFSEKEVSIKAGQTITFVNDDNVAHNVYTIINGEKVDLGLQRVGEKGDITYDEKNTYRVRCAIHPRMKLVVKVE